MNIAFSCFNQNHPIQRRETSKINNSKVIAFGSDSPPKIEIADQKKFEELVKVLAGYAREMIKGGRIYKEYDYLESVRSLCKQDHNFSVDMACRIHISNLKYPTGKTSVAAIHPNIVLRQCYLSSKDWIGEHSEITEFLKSHVRQKLDKS